MCTLTWHAEPDGYRIYFNRDERRERKPGLPAELRSEGTTRFIAPRDGDFGGTWIAVNEFGLGLCLLNGFPAEGEATPVARQTYTSRGRLPLHAIGERTIGRVEAALNDLDLERFRPFMMFALVPDGERMLASWSGRSLDIAPGPSSEHPLISSSFCTEQVRESRAAVFRALHSRSGTDLAALHMSYHLSHLPERGPYSTCMHREDATTVSFSRIAVGPRAIDFTHTPNAPCHGVADAPTVHLDRRTD